MGCVMAAGIAGARVGPACREGGGDLASPNVRTFRATYDEFNEFEPTAEGACRTRCSRPPTSARLVGDGLVWREAVAAEVNQIRRTS
jgi:hypothetical protein